MKKLTALSFATVMTFIHLGCTTSVRQGMMTSKTVKSELELETEVQKLDSAISGFDTRMYSSDEAQKIDQEDLDELEHLVSLASEHGTYKQMARLLKIQSRLDVLDYYEKKYMIDHGIHPSRASLLEIENYLSGAKP